MTEMQRIDFIFYESIWILIDVNLMTEINLIDPFYQTIKSQCTKDIVEYMIQYSSNPDYPWHSQYQTK